MITNSKSYHNYKDKNKIIINEIYAENIINGFFYWIHNYFN